MGVSHKPCGMKKNGALGAQLHSICFPSELVSLTSARERERERERESYLAGIPL